MKVFGDQYSQYYNLLYSDKDYQGEARYIDELIQRYSPNARTLLDLGCGTGRHDECLRDLGYQVHGVDGSGDMLQIARKAADGASLQYTEGDVRSVRLQQKFNAVVSLFHVMSYQTSNHDLIQAFITAKEHLLPGGVFIFDCWYGPAVLTDRPAVRIKRLENERLEVTRIAEPLMHPRENVVDVNYHLFIRDKQNDSVAEYKELHKMRYLFSPEVEWMLDQVGLVLSDSFEFLTGRTPGYDTWGVCFVAKRKE